MTPREFAIHVIVEDDWAAYRDIRLEMLADSPQAYLDTVAKAKGFTERKWRKRSGRDPHKAITIAAVSSQRWIGTAGAFLTPRGAKLVGVYVAPEHRGVGVLDALLDHVERWALERRSVITLLVHENNLRARRAYEKRGYLSTGRTFPYPLDPRESEVEMRKQLEA